MGAQWRWLFWQVELYSSEHTASGVEETGAPQTLARTYSSAMYVQHIRHMLACVLRMTSDAVYVLIGRR